MRRIKDFVQTAYGITDWIQLIGIRADEPRRAIKMQGQQQEGNECYLPLYEDGVTKEMVGEFWEAQNFDLQLPNNSGVTDWGNCDLCYLKGHYKKQSIIRARPDLADWWIAQEVYVGSASGGDRAAAHFRNDQPSYATMKANAAKQIPLFEFEADESISCFCGD